MKKLFFSTILFYFIISFSNAQNLQGYFPFSGNANDESVNSNNGVVNGAILTTDRFGNANNAFEFDGLNDYIQIPYNYSYSEMSITGWIYPYSTPHEGPVVFKFKDLYDNWGVFYRNGIHLLNDISNDNQQLYNTSITQNWHFFTILISNTNENKMYIDNVLVGSSATASNNLTSFIGDLFIGQRGSSAGFFNGKIDDIGIYNKVLSPIEIDSIFNYNSTTSILGLNNSSQLNIYPNPTSNQLSIIGNPLVINEINLIDITGKTLKTIRQNLDVINVTDLPNGIYFIQLITDEKVITKKFVKQ